MRKSGKVTGGRPGFSWIGEEEREKMSDSGLPANIGTYLGRRFVEFGVEDFFCVPGGEMQNTSESAPTPKARPDET